jgi:hypothetical protein
MVSAAVACLPASVSLLLLAALFMQISGVSLSLTWPRSLSLLRVLLCRSLCYKLSPFQAHWERWHCTRIVRHACLFTVHVGNGSPPSPVQFSSHLHFRGFPAPDYWAVLLLLPADMFVYSSCGKWVFPPLLWSFPPSATLTSFPAPGCWVHVPAPAGASPACPACLFTVPGRIPFPQSSELCEPHPLSRMSLLLLLLISQFLFFPQVEVCLSRGCAALAQACLWEYHSTAKLTWFTSFQAIWARATGGPGALLVSPFNVKWRVSAPAGGWRGQSYASSQWLCLQSVSPASLQDFIIGGSLSASSL